MGRVARVAAMPTIGAVTTPRIPMDLDAYERRTLGGGCFICAMTMDDQDREEKAANSGSV